MGNEKIIVAIPQKPILKGEHGRWGIPYGAMKITQELKENGFDATLYDFGATNNKDSEITHDLIPQHGTSTEEIKNILGEEKPDVLAISSQFTYLWKNTEHMIDIAKEISPETKIILGGNQAEAYGEIQGLPVGGNIDAIVRGTNPKSLVELLNSDEINKSKEMIITKKGKTNVEQFTPHDYSIINIENYSGKNHMNLPTEGKAANYLFTVGCNNACTYCQAPVMHGKQKGRRMEVIEEDFKNLKSRGIEELVIFDDNIVDLSINMVKELLELSGKYFTGLYLEGGIETSKLNEEFADLFKSTNVKGGYLAVETPNISLMKKLSGKFNSTKDYMAHIEKTTKLLHDRDIYFYTNSMCGWPGDTRENIQSEIDFQKWLKDDCGAGWSTFSTVKPFPGTGFYNVNKNKIAKGMDWQTNSKAYYLCGESAIFDGKDISAQGVGNMVRGAYEKINGKGLPMSPNPYWKK
ncbi:MAG: radical SAM protein [Nanoarchaeota archaeon]|jgi:radical SAM superfamily enzyme YgiQ (UPF0313 family)|nr:radical SAM protein [Nanoarchaeota archaeon]